MAKYAPGKKKNIKFAVEPDSSALSCIPARINHNKTVQRMINTQSKKQQGLELVSYAVTD